MKISELLIGVIMFSMVVTGFSIAYVSTATIHGKSVNDFSGPYNDFKNLSLTINSTYKATFGGPPGGTSTDDSETQFIRQVINGLMFAPLAVYHAHTMLVAVAEDFGVGAWVVNAVYLVIVVSVIMLIWSAIMKWEL